MTLNRVSIFLYLNSPVKGLKEAVLATVAVSVKAFLDKKPRAWVHAKGNKQARNRLYRMGISRILTEINEQFEIYGLKDDQWQVFAKNVKYDAFLVRKKLNLNYESERQKQQGPTGHPH